MGRWRPPTPESSPYVTAEGFAALQTELDTLWSRRRVVVKALAAAAAEGDRSENAEYIYRKKELGGMDRRIHYLQKRLPRLNVVTEQPDIDAVFFGALVELRNDKGKILKYRIVGPDETDARTCAISIDSPLAVALRGKRVDDEVVIQVDGNRAVMSIVSIQYLRPS